MKEVMSPLELTGPGNISGETLCRITFGLVDDGAVAPFDDSGKIIQLNDWLHLCNIVDTFYEQIDVGWIEAQHAIRDEQKWAEMGLGVSPAIDKWKPGYVYILQAGPFFKIGYSKDVDKRVSQLSTLPPFDLDLLFVIYAKNAPSLETALHKRFADKRKNGEWFELDEEDVTWLKTL